MVSLEEARSIIARQVSPLGAVMTPLASAHGRVLREDVAAREDLPAFDRSAMDGYAVAIEDRSAQFKVVGEVRPGELPGFALHPGECARVFTGARMPDGASQVIVQEHVRREGDVIVPAERNDTPHVRRRGEDARNGDLLLRAGTRLRATEMALLAQLGKDQPTISPAPRAIHLVTGDELVPPGGQPGPGQIRDSNSTLIASLLAEAGARLAHQRRVGDELPALTREAKAIPESAWDMLLISGGASVGDYDFGVEALTKLGFQIHFEKVNLRPGKPLVFASRRRQVAFVIPGNPVSHFVCFHVAIRLALERLEAAEPAWMLAELPLAAEVADRLNPRDTWWPARLTPRNGQLAVRPLPWRSSGDLCGLASANALVRVPPNSGPMAEGAMANCLLLDDR